MGKKQISKPSGQSLDITSEQIEQFKSIFPQAVRNFENNDQLKTNTVLQMESEKIAFKMM